MHDNSEKLFILNTSNPKSNTYEIQLGFYI